MIYGTVNRKEGSLAYIKFGKGKKVLLCFHGFGEHKERYHFLEEVLGDVYTIYAFDLFYHEQSTWNNIDLLLTKEKWRNYIDDFLTQENIRYFSLMAFSMGGRFAMSIIEFQAKNIKNVYLIAPDGVSHTIWTIVTQNSLLRRAFKYSVDHPSLFFNILNKSADLGFINPSLKKFAKGQMHFYSQRLQVYNTWVVFRKLWPDITLIAHLINKHEINTHIFIGKYDSVIPEKAMKPLTEKIEINYDLQLLDIGHQGLVELAASQIK